ncbi:MAG: sigma-54 dependent transcriptional regulator [Ignavibacteria bacterium]|jgi:transcriptional regulator with PAS, ATPase and Fis domain|nr:sigma-54 dependent transcriptional regulator [Ignavibacteria bacterium]MDH7527635.1 sigma-54 dependent transcriptional regulator [Ignavibacteria bacterium]NPV12194.1 sigma-54-dependent Fis family transcriptional regulator [Ignavibacteria bacterium]
MKPLVLLTKNQKMQDILFKLDQVIDSDSSIVLIGETGVGKELFAEYIHRKSKRSLNPFVKVGLSAIPAELLESELFGHEKGAFTGATSERKGLFEIANSGSIFLDDIDDFPLSLQSKLLRVLESKEILRIGSNTPIPIDVRLITASKVDLKDLVDAGKFRLDLYHRINVIPIFIPPLRERPEDIPLLMEYYLKHYAPDKDIKISNDALRLLIHYHWPGNVRELKNIAQRLAIFVNELIEPKDLPVEFNSENPIHLIVKACKHCFIGDGMDFNQVVSCLEINLIQEALRKTKGNQSQAAKALGLSLSTFRDKVKKYKIDINQLI